MPTRLLDYSRQEGSMEKKQSRTGRRLTYDELRAAEAAFRGLPFHDGWSEAAQTVYRGILAAKIKLNHERFPHGSAQNEDLQQTEVLVESAIDSEIERAYRL
jgi:hypothetical protein